MSNSVSLRIGKTLNPINVLLFLVWGFSSFFSREAHSCQLGGKKINKKTTKTTRTLQRENDISGGLPWQQCKWGVVLKWHNGVFLVVHAQSHLSRCRLWSASTRKKETVLVQFDADTQSEREHCVEVQINVCMFVCYTLMRTDFVQGQMLHVDACDRKKMFCTFFCIRSL